MTQDKTMNITDNLDYIAACELAECPPSLGAFAAPATPGLLKAGDVTDAQSGNEGAVVAGSVLAFPNGMSAQSKQDVMNSFLFATLVANKAFSSETQGDQWYDKFNEVLSNVGWLSTHWNYPRYRDPRFGHCNCLVTRTCIGTDAQSGCRCRRRTAGQERTPAPVREPDQGTPWR